jgi:hypothetical protein
VSHDVLRDAPDQDVFETRQPMRGRNDQVDIVIFCKGADINDRRSIRKRRFKFDGSEVHGPDELSHFALGSFPSSLLQAENIVDSCALARIDVSEIRGVHHNDLRAEFTGEADRVLETFTRAIGKVDRDKDGFNSES